MSARSSERKPDRNRTSNSRDDDHGRRKTERQQNAGRYGEHRDVKPSEASKKRAGWKQPAVLGPKALLLGGVPRGEWKTLIVREACIDLLDHRPRDTERRDSASDHRHE